MQYREKNRFAAELQHVKKLQELLPICAACKKIRDDRGYWNEIESYTYIEDHSDAQFTHGLCEECSEEIYGQEAWFIKN
ncbi:MAG: hypothetical protein SWO11_14535 [Thermodesulfobacteriota bacterium]|nr:hypothetical protein [Thermodesulfobacteriota bacterium]